MKQVSTAVKMFDMQTMLDRAGDAIAANLAAMHASGHYILGEQVTRFEAEFAHALGARFSVGCGTGTAALELSLRAAGVTNRDDEVIVPANTSLFTAQAVLAAGASLRIADVCGETLQMGLEHVIPALGPKVRAVIAVHLFGHAAPVEPLAALCRERGIILIQDACQAHGLRIAGRPLTEFSGYTCYSFYPTKNLGCLGDGGAVATDSETTAGLLKLLRDGGRDGDQLARLPGINSRLDELHACYLRALLPHLTETNAQRARVAAAYGSLLTEPECRPVRPLGDSVNHLYPVRAQHRDDLRAYLASRDIATGVHYPVPLQEHAAFTGRLSMASPPANAIAAAKEVLSLPIGPHVTEETAAHVAREVLRYYRDRRPAA